KHSSATGCPECGNNPTQLSIPEGQTYDLLDDNLDWTLDWLSSDLKFSESATVGLPDLEEQTNLQWLHQLPGPNKEETLDNLTKVEVIPATVELSSPGYGTPLVITSSEAIALDVAGKSPHF
ncbi:hypothetical protein L873DRAFT_1796679, partial [Choiromyces venosus 120613-1]